MMNILLTNDDGIQAPGLWTAARVLAGFGSVLVVAPAANQSGYGMALPPQREVTYSHYDSVPAGLRGVIAFSVAASPATCVQVGLSGALSQRPIDLVVSGINDALNLGRDVMVSGTAGAAFTAHLLGKPALAVSFDAGRSGIPLWETAGWVLEEVMRSRSWIEELPAPLLNINIPNRSVAELAGIRITSLSNASCLDRYAIGARSETTLRISQKPDFRAAEPEPESDAWAVARGYVSLTPLRMFPDILCGVPWGGAWAFESLPVGAYASA